MTARSTNFSAQQSQIEYSSISKQSHDESWFIDPSNLSNYGLIEIVTNDPATWLLSLATNQTIKQYNQTIGKLCKKNNIGYIKIYNKLSNQVGDFEDGLHPDPQAHQIIFKTVRDYLITNKII